MSNKKCPNCGKSVGGFFSNDVLVPQSKTDFLNNQLNRSTEAYCTDCYSGLANEIVFSLQQQKSEMENRLKKIIQFIPILSSQAHPNWEYEIIDLVSAQTTSGTGFITELSRSFNDFFGGTSGTMNRKVANATELCKSDLRIQCIKAGGNAVISTNIDYTEIGSGSSNMLMVCISGTAIKINNLEMLKNNEYISEVLELTEKLNIMSDIEI